MATVNQGPTSGLTPHLVILDNRAAEAIDFYKAAFGAEERVRMLADDGVRLMHAHLEINGASLMLNDDFPEYKGSGATPEGPPAGTVLHLQVDDADAWFDRAVAAGATVRMPLQDMFWGDRYGHVSDPFGHVWSIATPTKG
ncbi:VOC family protein [Polymorphobacter sp. PAMC 29334]|uniref:VOC family protein n=1 Tax=Polymorphobacter sp. PAMC 29334 TaxID=2862331 RepID=UPI001C67BF7C|nr:VOC family protein [Polymorphobacter sp. PAMC 29334]QYE34968.1 VOC family protein [Polymorphobacter sp. PAMC 29334]